MWLIGIEFAARTSHRP